MVSGAGISIAEFLGEWIIRASGALSLVRDLDIGTEGCRLGDLRGGGS